MTKALFEATKAKSGRDKKTATGEDARRLNLIQLILAVIEIF